MGGWRRARAPARDDGARNAAGTAKRLLGADEHVAGERELRNVHRLENMTTSYNA